LLTHKYKQRNKGTGSEYLNHSKSQKLSKSVDEH